MLNNIYINREYIYYKFKGNVVSEHNGVLSYLHVGRCWEIYVDVSPFVCFMSHLWHCFTWFW